MTQTLRVEVPGPASCWTLSVDGVGHLVNESVPVAPGWRLVVLRCDLVWPTARADGHLSCKVQVPAEGCVRLALPGVDLTGSAR